MQETNQNNPFSYRHNHDGINSEKLSTKAVASALGAPKAAITAASGSLSSGGAGSLSNADSATLSNALTRIAEIEARLESLGLITSN